MPAWAFCVPLTWNRNLLDTFRSTVIAHLEYIQINPWSGSRTAKKYWCFLPSADQVYLKNAKAWADAYYKSPCHEYVLAFMGSHFHGYQTYFDLWTNNIHLNKYMGDLYRETMRWIARVTNSGYILSVMWECDWDNLVRDNSEIKEHVESHSLSSPMTPQHALYGGRCKTCSFHASGTNTSVIKYVDVDVDVDVGLEKESTENITCIHTRTFTCTYTHTINRNMHGIDYIINWKMINLICLSNIDTHSFNIQTYIKYRNTLYDNKYRCWG